jgi:TatD DNase family protein
MSTFVDTHCHIDLYKAPEDIIALAERKKIYTIAVTNVPSVFLHTHRLATNCKYVRAALGLHPELVKTHQEEIELFQEYLPHTRYVGEIGLDYAVPDEKDHRNQRAILAKIAECVDGEGQKVLTIHSRRAVSDVLAILRGTKAKMILHWFSGNGKECDQAIASGFYFSVNAAMLKSAAGRKLIERIPVNRILTETDGPFVKDGPAGATPGSVPGIVSALAGVLGVSAEAARDTVYGNFKEILAIP